MSGDAFEQEELVEFFTAERNTISDLYPSERRFLGWLAQSHESVLDTGCAAGGLADVWRAYNPSITYRGVDVSTRLVDAARRLRPELEFLVGDPAEGLALPDSAADVVQALGWLHWEPRYRAALEELWRLAGRALFFDVRLDATAREDAIGLQHIVGGGTPPYVVVAWQPFLDLLLSLRPAAILGYGYEGAPAPDAEGVPDTVVFATFVLRRGDAAATDVCIDAPLPWPAQFGETANRYPPERLERLAPEPTDPGGES